MRRHKRKCETMSNKISAIMTREKRKKDLIQFVHINYLHYRNL